MKKLLCLTAAVIASVSTAAAAEDGAALFKTKCVACHTATGAGKPALKGTNLLTPEAKKATDEEMTAAISAGGKAKKAAHAFGQKGVTPEQVKALVAHVRTLQK
jgi:mono/diheme cytochrome c family protein